jgi:hypothetical protein
MLTKATYIVLSLASLGLLLFEAPRGQLLTSKPERGKVEHKAASDSSTSPNNNNPTVRSAYFVFIGGYHGGK